jgi:hypothetical protein
VYSVTGKIWALDVNKGRLRILKDSVKVHGLDDMITDIHADLRQYVVSTHENSLLPIKLKGKTRKFPCLPPPMETLLITIMANGLSLVWQGDLFPC